jgi:IS30 family transposase
MGRNYAQLSIEERCEIARLHMAGTSMRQIAAALDRQPSTIARELKRNRGQQGDYSPTYADQQYRARRWTGTKLDRNPALRDTVLTRLAAGWSPEQVAGRLAREAGKKVVSYETIYRFIDAQMRRTKDYRWRRYLPRGKAKRGWRGCKGGSPARLIALRCPISERPAVSNDRRTPGHWEADLMLFARYGQAILTLHERHARLLIATRPPNKTAGPIARIMARMLAPLPSPWRQTVTFDNGTEFAQHYDLHALDIETYFCDTYAPWQKGGIENAIGRLRRALPRKTDLATISKQQFTELVRQYNNTPRKCLDYQTPAELFWENVLHFKCESTPRPAPG